MRNRPIKRLSYKDRSYEAFGVHRYIEVRYLGELVGVLGKPTEDSWWQFVTMDDVVRFRHFSDVLIKNQIRRYCDTKKITGG